MDMDAATRLIDRYEGTLGGQLAVLAVMMLVWSKVQPRLRRAFETAHSKQPYWAALKNKRGGYMGTAGKELVGSSVSCLHHFLAGSLMLVGWALEGRTLYFRLGVLAEVAFELLDTIDMALGRGAWDSDDIKREAYVGMLAHHLPGIFLVFPLNIWCSCVELWQRCAMALELGGAISILFLCLRSILDDNKRLDRWLLLWLNIGAFAFLLWARFVVVTASMYVLIVAGLDIHCKTTYALIVGAILITTFNVMWAVDHLMEIRRALLRLGDKQKTA